MKHLAAFAFVSFSLMTVRHQGEQAKKTEPFEQLRFLKLKELNGSWEMSVDPKTGCKGIVYLYIIVHGPGGEADGFCSLFYDAVILQGEKSITVRNAAAQGVTFAGVKHGNVLALVTQPKERTRFAPFDVKLAPDLMATFKVEGKKLRLDLSKGAKHFLPKKLAALDVDWGITQWTRSDKQRIDK